MRQMKYLLVATVAMALALNACSSPNDGSKAGGTAAPVTLKIGTDDYPGKPASDQIEEFARRVEDLSEGSIVVEPVWHAAGDGADWDQRVAQMVVTGELDMGNIPARAWDTEGVTSLRALNAPFLVTTDELVVEVINGDLATDLMSGLEDIGVKGLTLLPEGLRHPFGFNKALMGPEDYVGATIRSPTSETTAAVFAALGATVTDDDPDFATQDGWESSFLLRPTGYATGNVVFYPKVNSIVINAEVFDRLSPEQREILEEAAAGTRAWAIENSPGEMQASAEFCANDQVVVVASDDEIAALEKATAPVYDALEADPLTKTLIGRITELKASSDQAPAVEACGGPVAGPGSDSPTSTVIDGVYRYEVTQEMLEAAGVTDPQVIRDNIGTWTWTFKRGEVGFVQTGPYPESAATDNADHFEIEGDILRIVWPQGDTEVWKWATNEHGDLLMTLIDPGIPSNEAMMRAHGSVPMIRIEDVAGASLPDGVYRAEIRLADVTAAGYDNSDGTTGTWTMVLADGSYQITCAIIDNPQVDCGHSGGTDDILEAGYATIAGNTVTFTYDAELHSELSGCALPCSPGPTTQVTWSLEGEDLVFTDLVADAPRGMSVEKILVPWVRIGDVNG